MKSVAAVSMLALLVLAGCRSTIYGVVDGYMNAAEAHAVQQAKDAARAQGVPLDTYDPLWDVHGDPGERYKAACDLIVDLFRNGVPLKDTVHVALCVATMLGYQYRPQAAPD